MRKNIFFYLFFTDIFIMVTPQYLFFLKNINSLLALDAFILIGIFSFKSYELEILSSYLLELVSVGIGSTLATIVCSAFVALFSTVPRFPFLFTWFVSISIFPIVHKMIYSYFLRKTPDDKYLVIGKDESVKKVMEEICKLPYSKIKVMNFVNPDQREIEKASKNGWKVLIADPAISRKVDLSKYNVEVSYLPELVERTLKRIPIEVIEKFRDYYEVTFDQIKESPAKRILDIFISVLALILFSPVIIIIIIGILIEDGRPVIFKQKRVGKDGRTFTIHKFRSMYHEKKKAAKFASQDSHRITKMGKFMRPYRFDEIPQFFDILRGVMSVVGPRPEQVEFVNEFSKKIPFYPYRHKIKPGLTGWAQINYNYAETLEEVKTKLSYDLWYVKNRNLLVDLKIILQTIETVLWRRGAK